MGSKVAYSFSTLPPAAVMAASALFENACALTASAFEIVPLPRIFTLSFDEMKPAAMSVSTLEAELARVTRTRLCTLVSTGSRAAVARTCTAADPFIVMR